MNLTMLLDMVAEGMPERVLIGDLDNGMTARELASRAMAGSETVRAAGADTVVYLDGNGPAFPIALFAAAYAGVPFLPVNYRLSGQQLDGILARRASPLVITGTPDRVPSITTMLTDEFVRQATVRAQPGSTRTDWHAAEIDPDDIAVLLMTSGTTAAPKSAVLRHRHLTSYVLESVEFASAAESDATIVSVPPYHIAAVANLLTNLYAGRRIVYLDQFTASEWLSRVRAQGVTHAMVVPTMLVRIVNELVGTRQQGPPSLRSLSYGGAKIAPGVLIEALRLFPDTGFVNAYGLTETASSIAVLRPEDHRAAVESDDPAVRARLASVGRALPGVEIEVHDSDGRPCAPGEVGDIVVRGPQVAGEYLETGTRLEDGGWFPTRDLGSMDEDGFIFVQGRSDDTIIRGGENIAPSEIEDVLAGHPWVGDVAVAGIPDEEWGHRVGAFIVPKPGTQPDAAALREYARAHLRSAKTPDQFIFLPDLPRTPTGKILRRQLVELAPERADSPTG